MINMCARVNLPFNPVNRTWNTIYKETRFTNTNKNIDGGRIKKISSHLL